MPESANKTTRATISFPADQYDMLEELAKSQRVSLAWVVRRAVEQYLDSQWPLLSVQGDREEGSEK